MSSTSGGGTATITCRASTMPRPVCTRTDAVALVDPVDRCVQRDLVAELRASRSGISWEPPTKRRSCAPFGGVGVARERADVALVAGAREVPEHEEQRELVGVGAEAGLGPALDQVGDASGLSRDAPRMKSPSVIASHAAACGCVQGASTAISAA